MVALRRRPVAATAVFSRPCAARIARGSSPSRSAQRGAVAGDLADELPMERVEAVRRVDRAEAPDGGPDGGLVGQQRLLVLLGRARRRDARLQLREAPGQAGLSGVERLDVGLA